jgi:hypothetical protein
MNIEAITLIAKRRCRIFGFRERADSRERRSAIIDPCVFTGIRTQASRAFNLAAMALAASARFSNSSFERRALTEFLLAPGDIEGGYRRSKIAGALLPMRPTRASTHLPAVLALHTLDTALRRAGQLDDSHQLPPDTFPMSRLLSGHRLHFDNCFMEPRPRIRAEPRPSLPDQVAIFAFANMAINGSGH